MTLKSEMITKNRKDHLIDELKGKYFFEEKAEINGCCIKLITDDQMFKEMWQDNFKSMSEYIRPHGRIFALRDPEKEGMKLYYEPVSKTCFLYNCNYYGNVKSIALAIAGDFLEEYHSIHSRYSVHGAAIDVNGRGISLIAPSGTGKTTLSYGLLLDPKTRLVSDDWFYAQILGDLVVCRSSEKNVYIRASIKDTYPEFKKIISCTKLDDRDRGIIDIGGVLGNTKKADSSTLFNTVFLKRDYEDEVIYNMSVKEALDFLLANDFCNPHMLITNPRKISIRKKFFKEFFERTRIFMLNTIEKPEQSLERLRKLV
ncbi:MAG: hypothetical protein JW825_06335 [Candidatus Methanofastidiosa archaeon]|nr:hypothetical protein [Candidatus Methanofastidiosa archaeon]